jgi:gas vesicle protein
MSSGKALLGVLAGIAAGAALGILFAPEKGSNTRKKMVKKGEDLANAINKKLDEKFDEVTNAIAGKSKKSKSPADAVGTEKAEMVE